MITDGGAIFHRIQVSKSTAAVAVSSTAEPPLSPSAIVQCSPCRSPVPYLFTGLAVMLGLIVFALLVLACSYWKLSGRILNDEVNGRRVDVEGGGDEKEKSNSGERALPVLEDKFLVIMAGERKPTFLATPISSRVTSCDG